MMLHIDATKVAISLLNTTLGLEDLPMEIHGRIATALVILDQQNGENFYNALQDAYAFIGRDNEELEALLKKLEDETNG